MNRVREDSFVKYSLVLSEGTFFEEMQKIDEAFSGGCSDPDDAERLVVRLELCKCTYHKFHRFL